MFSPGTRLVLYAFAIAAAFAYGGQRYRHSVHEASAPDYIRQVLPQYSSWNPHTVRALMTPQAVAAMGDPGLDRVVAWEGQLGRLRSMQSPQFVKELTGTDPVLGDYSIELYRVAASFDAGDADVMIGLLDRDEKFSIFLFHIHSSALQGSPSSLAIDGFSQFQ